ncbi:molybdopterin-guanine dinucleotide biosynthesis protein B [Neobacillus niacini]|nr:molybdopterin-guanine dinucleotide biosynthesis protein B [Neobacillus niacini]MDR7000825.1 molybdopterin-guanine dinucleotide biosynthesis protein B [Neobacillus niacini]
MVKPVVFQVVGYQNSGKTTVTGKLIEALNKLGLKVVTIKHHGHGGKPNLFPQKDSSRHIVAGALASIVEGEGRLLLQVEKTETTLEEQIELLKNLFPDVILIEGHKQKDFPKLLILKDKADLSLLETVKNVEIILYWDENLKPILEKSVGPLLYNIHDQTAINKIAEYLTKKEA